MPPPPLSVVVVTHDSREAVASTLPPLLAQLRDGDELIVVDNGSADGTPELVAELAPGAIVLRTAANPGFAAACNRGAEAATGELLCMLNPDAVPQPGWREAIERPLVEGRGWAAWQALVTADGGRTINTRGGVVHFTGISWAGGAGEPLAATGPALEREPGFVSGACLAIPRLLYAELGGMPEKFFLYHEDVDLSLRVRLAGGPLGVEPAARVDHDYEFAKGPSKWLQLERNRWATLIRTYPGALLVAARARAGRDRAGAGGRRGGGRLAAAEAARLGRRRWLRCRGCSASGARSKPGGGSAPASSRAG